MNFILSYGISLNTILFTLFGELINQTLMVKFPQIIYADLRSTFRGPQTNACFVQ